MNIKLFLNEYKKPLRGIIAFLGFVIAIPSWAIDYKSVLESMVQYAGNVITYLILFIVFLFCVIIFLCYQSTKNRSEFHLPNNDRRRHSILIFDDKNVDLQLINDYLNGYDLDYVLLKDITDYRLAESFEIIIGDIFGLGAGKNSISILNTIKEKYPYKIVLAMSNVPSQIYGLNIDDKIVNKQNRENYPKDIYELIRNYSLKLDNANDHWKHVSSILIGNNISEKEIKRIEFEYCQFIKRKRHTDQMTS